MTVIIIGESLMGEMVIILNIYRKINDFSNIAMIMQMVGQVLRKWQQQ